MAVLLLLAVACSSNSSTKSSGTTDSGGAATSSDGGSASSDSAGSSGKAVTTADLAKLLPSASSVGSGFTEATSSSDSSTSSDSSGGGDPFQAAAEKQCPELGKLLKGETPESQKAKRTYKSSSGDSIEVSLHPKAKTYSSDELDKQIKAINDCGEISVTLSGNDAKVSFSAKRDDSLGDQGLVLRATVKVGVAQLNKAFTLKLVGYTYRVGTVTVTVTASGELDPQTLTVVEPDEKTAKTVAEDLQPKVKRLVKG